MTWNVPYLPTTTIFSGSPINSGDLLAFATQQRDASNSFVLELQSGVDDITPPEITPEWPEIPGAPVPVSVDQPSFENVVWVMPGLPTEFTATLDIGDYMPEAFDDDPPTLAFGSPPAEFTALAPDAPSVGLVFDDPTLTVNLPSAPDLLTLNIQSFGGVDIPAIDFTLPELNIVAPDVQTYSPGALYTSALLAALQTTLQDRVENGGTGLSADVEQAIWDRGRQRELLEYQDSLGRLDRMETLGYAFPSGTYLDARLRLIRNLDEQHTTISREIMIEQARLEQTNVQQSLEIATRLEGQLIDYNNAVEQRLLEAARYATEAGVAIYNARVNAYTAYVDAYRAKVQIYEAQVRAELAKVEAYQAEIQAEEAKARINTALVDQYRVQVDAALADIQVFQAQINAIRTKAEIEKLKVEIYGEQVRGYTARVNAYTAGIQGFQAQLQGEVAKQDAYRSRVQAYTAQVEAGSRVIDSKIAEYTAQLRAKEVEWEGYKSEVDGQASRAQAIAAQNNSIATAYTAEVRAVEAYNDALTKQWQVAVDQAQRVTEIGISAAKANAELYVTTRSLALDAAKVGAQVSAQLGASALGVLNLSDSYNSSMSSSFATGYSYNAQQSFSESTSVSL